MNISIIGAGYVGLVTGACLAAHGHSVILVDANAQRVKAIAAGKAPIAEPGLEALLKAGAGAGRLSATTDLAAAVKASAVTFIAVGTPEEEGRIDLSQVAGAARQIGEALGAKAGDHLVVVKSTVVPGTTEGLVARLVARASGRSPGAGFGLAMNPEFLREGEAVDDFMRPDRIVIGAMDEASAQTLLDVYAPFDCDKLVTSVADAEFIKYASNALLATCISFANELAGLCERFPGADVEQVLDGLHLDKRLSPTIEGRRIEPGILTYLRPSSGYGGSCLPKDIAALRGFAGDLGAATPLLDAVAKVNAARPPAVVDLAEASIGGFAGRRVALLGLTFKAGTDDVRHSPALALAQILIERGASLSVYDPIGLTAARRVLGDRVTYALDALSAAEGADVVTIGAAWPEWRALDWQAVSQRMRGALVFDPRNALRGFALPERLTRIGIGVAPPRQEMASAGE